MRPREEELRRAASRLVGEFSRAPWVEMKDPVPALEQRVLAAFLKNFEDEAALDRDAQRMLDDLGRKTAGMDQRKLFLKIREQLAKDRGFVL